jgi:mono/diheme cytochrome c family protein
MRIRRSIQAVLLFAFASSVGMAVSCGKSGADTAPPDGGAEATAQIKEGLALYGEHCAGCHGRAGQGGQEAPVVVGVDAFPIEPLASAKTRTMNFETAADVLGYIREHMPPESAGLDDDEYHAIMAWLLNVNGWKRQTPLTEANAAEVQIAR